MKDRVISLNGRWDISYLSPEVYAGKDEPILTENKITLANAVPRYFEDMREELSKAPFFDRIAINPLYKRQTYPETGYCEDTVLKTYLGTFIYAREEEITDLSGDFSLFVGGVQNRLSLWINGSYIDTHEGYSTDFEFAIPKETLVVGKNRFTLAVSNNRLSGYMGRPVSGLTSRAANECTGGIYGDVEIRIRHSGLYDAYVTTSPDLTEIKVNLSCTGILGYTVSIFDGDALIAEKKLSENESSISFSTDGLAFWSPDSPKLYTARITDGESEITRRFGVRRLTVDGIRLRLNGEPYFFRGFCEHCYHPVTVHPTRDEAYYEKVIVKAKKLGFNSIRFHTYVPPVEYMAAADRLGILIEVETPNNTSLAEWREIVRMCRRYTSVAAFSSGNEMTIDEDYIEHLRSAANTVHTGSDALFSPMSAMRGVEYFSYGDCKVEDPFPHNPHRLTALSEFCDIYNTYSLGLTSYTSANGDSETLDTRNAIYKKPLLSHEICIQGTYQDLSVEERYEGTRIGETEMFSSVREHLTERGLIDRWQIYFKNSVAWQMLLRKHCFETLRRSDTFAGYDFLGDIDTHWHTFGYSVGMMNEFYELKPGESIENVLRYNSDNVLLADLPNPPIFDTGAEISIPILISAYGNEIKASMMSLSLSADGKEFYNEVYFPETINRGGITKLFEIEVALPKLSRPTEFTLTATLTHEDGVIENDWKLYSFPAPTVKEGEHPYTLSKGMNEEELISRLNEGERVVILGAAPFEYEGTSFQISLAGRTNGHLATVIRKHPLTEKFPTEAHIGWHLAPLMNGGRAAMLDIPTIPFEPIIEIATSYKNAHREAILFEYRVGEGKLLVCTANLNSTVGSWLKGEILSYAASDDFSPSLSLTPEELRAIINCKSEKSEENTNLAFNKNDITAT